MGFISVVTLNMIWLNLKKHRDKNQQNDSSPLYTLGESNWTLWLFLGPWWNQGTKIHSLPVWHFVSKKPNFCIMILPLVTALVKMYISCHSASEQIWTTCSYYRLFSSSQLAVMLQGTVSFFLGSLANIFPYVDGKHFLKIYTWW